MEHLRPYKQDALLFEDDSPTLISTLEQCLNFIQQEQYIEGIALLVLVHKQLSPDQTYLAAALNDFIQGHTLYWQAQQALHHTSQRFAEAVTEQQTRLVVLHNLLTAQVEVKEKPSQQKGRVATLFVKDPQHQDPESTASDQLLPSLYGNCFGHFEVKRSGKPVALCSIRFLVTKRKHCATSDTLQALLRPNASSVVALNKLHIAISALRRSPNHRHTCEPGGGYILYKNQFYFLNLATTIRTDVDDFLHYYHAGQQCIISPEDQYSI